MTSCVVRIKPILRGRNLLIKNMYIVLFIKKKSLLDQFNVYFENQGKQCTECTVSSVLILTYKSPKSYF